MAHKRNRNNKSSRRDAPRIANRRLFEETFTPRSLSPLTLMEDRRLYSPEPYTRPAASLSQPRHRLVIKNVPKSVSRSNARSFKTYNAPATGVFARALPDRVAFQTPKRVLICIRRQKRKEVIHALNKSGRGVSRKNPRRSEYSDVSC